MLETIREFALERLDDAGEGDDAQRVLAEYALAFAEEHRVISGLPTKADTVGRVTAEWPTLLAALEWLAATGAEAQIGTITAALGDLYESGDVRAGRLWIERALAPGSKLPPATRTSLTITLSMIVLAQGDPEHAERLSAEAVLLARRGGDVRAIATALVALGGAATALGASERAVTFLSEALVLARQADNGRPAVNLVSSILANLGVAVHCLGRLEEAQSYHTEALAGYQAVGSVRGEMIAQTDLGDVALDRGDIEAAVEWYRASLRLACPYGEKRIVAEALGGVACATVPADPAVATRLFAAAARLREESGLAIRLPFVASATRRGTDSARNALGERAFATAWATGAALPLDRAVAEALQESTRTPTPALLSLTPRERAVLQLMAEGKTDRVIGEALFLARRTAEWYAARVCAKLGAKTRTAAVATAIAAGLIAPPTTDTSQPLEDDPPPS